MPTTSVQSRLVRNLSASSSKKSVKRLAALAATLALGVAGLASVPMTAEAAIPKTPCGAGSYYGGGSEIPPGSDGIQGSILVTAGGGRGTGISDRDGDGWVCYGPLGYTGDNRGKIPKPSRNERIYRGDVMGPPLGGGLCCNGDLAIDRQRNLFHAAGLSSEAGTFNSVRIFYWDSNDIFYVDGRHVSQAAFERALGEGDLFTAVYASRTKDRSVFSFYNHEV